MTFIPRRSIENKFKELKEQWKKDTAFLSSSTKMAEHPAYREIITIGSAVVPFLIDELRREPDHWFEALREITGVNPIEKEHAGYMNMMAIDWITWFDSSELNA